MDNRNNQQNKPGMGQQGGNQQGGQNTGGTGQNPQDGSQWDNYQTRELSTEGGENIQEGDLMNADEASKQKPQHREDNS